MDAELAMLAEGGSTFGPGGPFGPGTPMSPGKPLKKKQKKQLRTVLLCGRRLFLQTHGGP